MPKRTALDPERGVTKKVIRLGLAKAESEQLQSLINDPAIIAARIEDRRRSITRGMWFFLTLGLAFTTSGVQHFLASGRPMSDPLWWGAWLIEPMAAGILIMLLSFETEILACGIEHASGAVSWLKRILLFATLFMNVWPSVADWKGDLAGFGVLFIHALVPVVVFFVAEVLPVIQRRMREAATAGYRNAAESERKPPTPTPTPAAPVAPVEPAPRADAATEAVPQPATPAVPRSKLRLPASMLATIRATADRVAEEGRALTVQDIQTAVKVPDDLAAQIVAEAVSNNGHAFQY